MLDKYASYIKNVDSSYGQCASVTLAMNAEFPELKRVRGHYYCWVWGERAHWWLVTEGGEIVDPTASQFPSKGKGVYSEWDDSWAEPTGVCPNCGETIYHGGYVCDDDCGRAFVAHCTSRI